MICCSSCSSDDASFTAASCSTGVMPSAENVLTPLRTSAARPDETMYRPKRSGSRQSITSATGT